MTIENKVKKLTILLLEDEKSLSKLYQKIITNKGFSVIHYDNAEAGIETIANKIMCHGVITDNNLLRMKGITFVEKVRQYGYNKPILLHSGEFIGEFKKDERFPRFYTSCKDSIKYITNFLNIVKCDYNGKKTN